DLLLRAVARLHELEIEAHLEIGAATHVLLPLPAPSAAEPEHLAEPEHVAERREDVGDVREVRIEAATLQAFVPKAVVDRTLLLVGEDLVGLGRLLELGLGLRIVWVAIRVVLKRELAVGLLQVLRRGVPGNAQDL